MRGVFELFAAAGGILRHEGWVASGQDLLLAASVHEGVFVFCQFWLPELAPLLLCGCVQSASD
jgi:hypothetical protein